MIESDGQTFTLDLHPRLTVVAGMGRLERQSLVGELVGALGGSRSGVHVEIEQRDGRHLAVFRPTNGPHRVVDVDRATDVTSDFAGEDGSCDLLAGLGLSSTSARHVLRVDGADLAADSHRREAVEALSSLDQGRVWSVAEELVRAERELTTEAEALGSAPEDAAVIDEVERRHAAVERAAEALESTRRHTFWISGASSAITLPGVLVAGAAGFGFLAVAVLAVLASLIAKARLDRADKAEEQALAMAGATSYLGFQLQRVNGLLGDDVTRRSLMGKAATRRTAQAAWQQLAGDIPVDWAVAHREEIEVASQLRREVEALGSISATAPQTPGAVADELAHVLVGRLAEARSLAGEGVPLILDDPFREVDPSVKPLLLELLGRSAGQPQIVFLTEDDDVASWARLEALTGELSLVEPAPEPADRLQRAAS